MRPVDRILEKIGKDKFGYNDLHILRFYSCPVIVSGGKVIGVLDPALKYCPLANSLYRNFRTIDKVAPLTKKCISKASLIEKSPLTPLCQRGVYFLPLAKGGEEGFYNQCLHTYDRISIFKNAVRDAVEEKIDRFGFFTENRKIYQKEISIPYGASEILMYALSKKQIQAAVIVCDGAGTVISSNPEIVQGIGARMNGLFFTTSFQNLVKRLEKNNCTVIPGGKINQIEGVKIASQLGYRNIAVTVNGYSGENLSEIREIESIHNVSITILVVCTTGIGKKRILEIKKHADLVWSCGSEGIRNIIGKEAILQMSVIIPVFVLTRKGVNLVCSYFSDCKTIMEIDTGRQYIISHVPRGEEIKVGNFKAYLRETKLPIRSKKEPY
jgi:putative methanogenesis marker protein 8